MDLQIIKIATDNKNQKILRKYTHEIKNKNAICGDEITIKLLINNKIITGISSTQNDAKVTLVGVKDKPGVAASIFCLLYTSPSPRDS